MYNRQPIHGLISDDYFTKIVLDENLHENFPYLLILEPSLQSMFV